MDFFKSRYYRYNAILLTLIGQWPYHSSKWKQFQQLIIHIDIITVMTVQMIKMFKVWGDVDIMIECITPVGVQLAACAKSFNQMSNCDKMKKLLDHMQMDWSSLTNKKDNKLFSQIVDSGRKSTVTYGYFLFGSLVIYLMIPLMPSILDVVLPLNETRQRRFLYQTEYFVDSDDNYVAIAVHTYSGTILTIITVVGLDAMFATYIHHACGLLAVEGDRLKSISEPVTSGKFNPNVDLDDDKCYRELVRCIKKHKDAIKFALLVESSYSNMLLFQLTMCTVLMSISLLQLLLKLGQYDEMYRILQFTFAQLFHLFYSSWAGQKLIDQSIIFSESVYYVDWHTFSLRSQNLIKFVMMGAAKPLKITAGKFYIMSMESYGAVVQTSLSYFTVLASVQ